MSRGILKIQRYLMDAKNASMLSTCNRRRYGAVIEKDDRTISTGYNGSPRGVFHCCDRGACWRTENGIPSGQQYEKCIAVHAEQNALYRASWEDKQDANLYLYGEDVSTGEIIDARPCEICMTHIANNGIKRVYCYNSDGSCTLLYPTVNLRTKELNYIEDKIDLMKEGV